MASVPGVPRALVTGGSGNLGFAVARVLLDRGWTIHVTVRDRASRMAFESGLLAREFVIHDADVSLEADVRRLYEEVGSPLAALVATVGGYTSGPFAELTAEAMDQQYSLNLKSAALTLRHAHAALRANPGGGAAVLIANRPALGAGPGVAFTSALKAGLASLARSVAAEWKPDGISVNAVAPGIMDTPENRASFAGADPALWPTPEEVAQVIGFLVSREARIVSGATIPVFGRS